MTTQDRPNAIAEGEAFDIIRLRWWHHLLNELLKRKSFQVPVHLDFGHEAAVVALNRNVGPDDTICLTHRNAAYNLMQARSLDAVLEHYRLKVRTPQGALMGSMNLVMPGTAIGYSSSILGNALGVGAGFAMNRVLNKKPGVTFTFTGDGAMEEGIFWETLIFARSHKLPLVVIIENDNHSMSSTIAQRRSPIDLSLVCEGLGVKFFGVDGADFTQSQQAIAGARASAAEGVPACVELSLKTFNQHAGPTPGWPDDPLKIDIAQGMIVRENDEDPLFVLRKVLGEGEFNRLAEQVMKADDRDNYLH